MTPAQQRSALGLTENSTIRFSNDSDRLKWELERKLKGFVANGR